MWLQESGELDICAKRYGKTTETTQDVSISRFFQFWLERISFFTFIFSLVFYLFNASKTMP